ncbi:MAG: hypothetical protein ACREIE_02655, partial [Nitrospiraceae bacterium]
AYGLFNAAIGITAFPASLLAGLLWQWLSPAAPFFFGAALAFLSAGSLLLMDLRHDLVRGRSFSQ